jgi:hypothetical protein
MTDTGKWPDQRGSAVLSPADCRRLLAEASGSVGRLGYVGDGGPVVLPLNYVLLDGEVCLRLGPGRTLETLLGGPTVAFEIDHCDALAGPAPEAWSVLAQGRARVLRDPVALDAAAAMGLTPLVSESGQVYVLVRPERLSGRRFAVGALARFGLQPMNPGPS